MGYEDDEHRMGDLSKTLPDPELEKYRKRKNEQGFNDNFEKCEFDLKGKGYVDDRNSEAYGKLSPASVYLKSSYGAHYKTTVKKRIGGGQLEKIEKSPVIRSIDYIFHTADMVTTRTLECESTMNILRKSGDLGMPFTQFPSDHLPLCADIKLE